MSKFYAAWYCKFGSLRLISILITSALSSSSIFQSFREMRVDVDIGLDCGRMFQWHLQNENHFAQFTVIVNRLSSIIIIKHLLKYSSRTDSFCECWFNSSNFLLAEAWNAKITDLKQKVENLFNEKCGKFIDPFLLSCLSYKHAVRCMRDTFTCLFQRFCSPYVLQATSHLSSFSCRLLAILCCISTSYFIWVWKWRSCGWITTSLMTQRHSDSTSWHIFLSFLCCLWMGLCKT